MEFKTVDQLTSKVGGNKFLLPLDIQFFAEGDPAPADPAPSDPIPNSDPSPSDPAPNDPAPTEPVKSFTQEDVNGLVAKEAKKAQEKLLKQLGIEDFKTAKEGLQKFQEWQDSQKTEAEKQSERLKSLEENFNKTSSENEALKAQLSALKVGVKSESVQDVVTLAKNLVTDEVDMDVAIQQVIEKYPHFKAEQEPTIEDKQPSFSTGQHQKTQETELEKWVNAFKF